MIMPAIIVLTQSGLAVAGLVRAALGGAEIHGLAGRVDGADRTYDSVSALVQALFADGVPIIGVCASGILVRAVAPVLGNKRVEPPVIAVAEDTSCVVPLVGGHHGGNDLARRIATALQSSAAITTASDVRFGLALDDPPPGWRVANPAAVKPVAAALLAHEPVALRVEAADAAWLRRTGARFAEYGESSVLVTDGAIPGDEHQLVLHPSTLVVGVGSERGADPHIAIDLVRQTLADAGLSPMSVACVASIDLKMDEPAVHAVAEALGVPARFFDATTLERETPRLANPSQHVFTTVGCHGVSEGAALAGVGADGLLMVEKQKRGGVTCAVGRAGHVLDPLAIGQARGRLAIIGIGPGDAAWRTAEAMAELRRATDLVGYSRYLDLVSEAEAGGDRHAFDLGAETARCRAALDLAAAGREVALVCSGDAGIYAMAALVFELIDRAGRVDWRRIDIHVVPGLSALQAAAARAGAPLGHDFCAVSLSDLLTPWSVIERRLQAAADADFVTAIYNPRSSDRQWQLPRALEILQSARPPETPVVVARNLGRSDESIDITALSAVEPTDVDMLTVLIVGAAGSRRFDRGAGGEWVYTARGYASKPANDG